MTGIHQDELDLLQSLPGYDPSYEPIHFGEWSDYEENGWLFVLRKGDQLYTLQGGHCVMASADYVDTFSPFPVGVEEALEEMLLYEQAGADSERRMFG